MCYTGAVCIAGHSHNSNRCVRSNTGGGAGPTPRPKRNPGKPDVIFWLESTGLTRHGSKKARHN